MWNRLSVCLSDLILTLLMFFQKDFGGHKEPGKIFVLKNGAHKEPYNGGQKEPKQGIIYVVLDSEMDRKRYLR